MTNFEPLKMYTAINLEKGIRKAGLMLLLVVLMVVSQACSSKKSPEGALDRDQFVQVLMHFYLNEARLNTLPIQRDSALLLFQPHEKAYLEAHHISDQQLKLTYKFYTDHPEEFEKVYDIVIDSLSVLENKAIRTYPNDLSR